MVVLNYHPLLGIKVVPYLGQYLNPTKKHAPVARFYTPEEFDDLKLEALKRGFKHVVSGPLVRSSYHAHEHVPENLG